MRSDYEAAQDWIKSINPYDLSEEFRDHREAAYVEERAKIVAWLRSEAGVEWICEDIEAGEHLK